MTIPCSVTGNNQRGMRISERDMPLKDIVNSWDLRGIDPLSELEILLLVRAIVYN
jgi:hypothetical protein